MARCGPDTRAPSKLRLYAWCAAAITAASVATVFFTQRGAAIEAPIERATAPLPHVAPSYLSISAATAAAPAAAVAQN
jgi:hypothetical protein